MLLLLLLLLLWWRLLVSSDLAVDFIERPSNLPKSVPLGEYRVTQLDRDIYFATQKLLPDVNRCPNGVFSTAIAVDRSVESALQRARFEAAERFAMAAIGDATSLSPCSSLKNASIFRYPFDIPWPLNGKGRTENSLYVQIGDAVNCSFTHVAAADVFAPFPTNRAECSWHPTSNGVAVGATAEEAKFASFCEYFERHCIMEFWYKGGASFLVDQAAMQQYSAVETEFLSSLGYDLFCVEISTIKSMSVVLTFARNKAGEYPGFVCSAGAGKCFSTALKKASQETIQTLVACASQAEQFSKWKSGGAQVESLDHRMYCLADVENFTAWEQALRAIEADSSSMERRHPPDCGSSWLEEIVESGHSLAYVDLTPSEWRNNLHCFRCLSSTMIPLIVAESMLPAALARSGMRRFNLPHPFP